MPTIDANGLTIGYDVAGAGPPLILLHGATSDAARDFRGQLPTLTEAFRCYTPDARGHGRTRWDTATDGFSADWLADDLLAFADALDLATFHLLGFSLGAMTALRVAVRAPERLRTLVVVGITTDREPRASVARRLMDPIRIDRDDPSVGGRPLPSPRSRAGCGCLASAAPGHRARRRDAIAADAARDPDHRPADARGGR